MKIFKNVYSDIPMFLSKNSFTGDINLKKDNTSIKESIKNIVLTINFERPFDSEFGTPASNGLFENPLDFSFYVENAISAAITRYEPRVNLTKINSTFNDKTVEIDIKYQIPNYEIVENIRVIVERLR